MCATEVRLYDMIRGAEHFSSVAGQTRFVHGTIEVAQPKIGVASSLAAIKFHICDPDTRQVHGGVMPHRNAPRSL